MPSLAAWWKNLKPLLLLRFWYSILVCFLAQPLSHAATLPAASIPLLTSVAQIKNLTPQQAAEGRLVRLEALVTFHSPQGACFIQDATDAIYLVRRSGGAPLQAGDRILVHGSTAPGDYAPVLVEQNLEVLGSDQLPPPEQVSFPQLASGQRDCKWVEIRGVVRWMVDARPSHLMTQLALPEGKIRVYLYRWTDQNPELLVGATLRVRGAVGASFNRKRQLVAPFLYVNAPSDVVVEKSASPHLTNTPLTSASSLLQYAAPGQFGERVRVRGTVLHQMPGQFLFIRDAHQGLQMLTLSTDRVAPGSIVEARGFPVMGAYSPILEDADFQEVAQAPPPAPVAVTIQDIRAGKCDADLISVEAELVDSVQRENEQFIVLQESNMLFSAHLPVSDSDDFQSRFPRHSRLRITGVCQVQETKEEAARLVPLSFRLLLRSPKDVAMVRKPSWWTPSRLLAALAVVAFAALAATIWIWVLRRKVSEQTEFIREQLRNEAALEERSRLARELHDSIEQNLAGIAMQMDTAAAKFAEAPQSASRLLDLSRHLMRRTQDELHSSVWDLRSHLFQTGGLEAALKTVAEPLERAGLKAIVGVSGHPRRLSAVTENHLLRIAQESINNVLKHAEAKTVNLDLAFLSATVTLQITDDGIGFDSQNPKSSSDGHFGLLGMRERAEKLGGRLMVHSAPGRGTRVIVEAPAMEFQTSASDGR